jgi:hypothetical protein
MSSLYNLLYTIPTYYLDLIHWHVSYRFVTSSTHILTIKSWPLDLVIAISWIAVYLIQTRIFSIQSRLLDLGYMSLWYNVMNLDLRVRLSSVMGFMTHGSSFSAL